MTGRAPQFSPWPCCSHWVYLKQVYYTAWSFPRCFNILFGFSGIKRTSLCLFGRRTSCWSLTLLWLFWVDPLVSLLIAFEPTQTTLKNILWKSSPYIFHLLSLELLLSQREYRLMHWMHLLHWLPLVLIPKTLAEYVVPSTWSVRRSLPYGL